MVGGLNEKAWRAAAFAAGLLGAAGAMPAAAADLGGNCCADLEERIAELEATTARKGNRKVSLTISGWVNQAVFFWDDGVENNAYVGTNGLEQDRFRVLGEAGITSGWTAGYILEAGINGNDSKKFSQDSQGSSNNISLRKSAWFIKSKQLGKLTVGKFDPATYHLIDNVDTLLTRNVSDYEATGVALGAFKTRSDGVLGPKWTDIMGGFSNASVGQTGLRNVVRYDTPTFAGFTASAAWGEDDQWDIALNYRGDVGDFKVNGAIGYGESSDPKANGAPQCTTTVGTGDCQWWGIGALVQHTPTGLYVYGGYTVNEIDLTAATLGADDKSNTWYIQAGIERKWFPIGKTNMFGEYRNDDVGLTAAADSSKLDFWAAGVVQNIESADMSFYAVYRHFDGEFTDAGTPTNLDAFDMVITGAKINF
jgi:predicted porin